jgi:RNA polymerase sigma-70 factor (ECF subfamily)
MKRLKHETMDELALVRTAQAGDEASFRGLFDSHHRRIYSLAFRYLRNAADAEDVLQETFIRAYRALSTYDPERGLNFSAWINRIGIHCSIDALRRNRKRNGSGQEDEIMNALPDRHPESDPERTARNREVRERVAEALDRLSPKQRMIFTLRHYEGFTMREIAESAEITEGAVKKHLFRAVDALKRRLRRFAMEERP